MLQTEGSPQAFSTDPHLNDSINEVLSEFADDGSGTGAAPTPTQDGTGLVEATPPAAPIPGDQSPSTAPASAPSGSSGTPAPKTPTPDPDPQYEPFRYQMPNGEARTMDGSFRIPGEGLFVPEAHVGKWEQIAVQAATLERENREITERAQSTDKLTTWQVPTNQRDGNGRPVYETLTGQRGAEAMRISHAEMAAKTATYDALFKDPQQLASLLTVVRDAEGNVTGFEFDPREVRNLQTQMENATLKFTSAARQNFASITAPAPVQPAAEAPIAELAMPTVEATIRQLNVTGLNAEDKQFLAAQLPRYVRATTPEEKRAGFGTRIVDASFGALIQREGARVSTLSNSAQAKAAADKFNNGQNRGRAGQRPAAPAAPIPQPTPEPKRRRSRNEKTGASWDDVLAHGLADPDVQAALNGA